MSRNGSNRYFVSTIRTDIEFESLKTIAPNFFLSMIELSEESSISFPNSVTISCNALLPGSYTTWANLSASGKIME